MLSSGIRSPTEELRESYPFGAISCGVSSFLPRLLSPAFGGLFLIFLQKTA